MGELETVQEKINEMRQALYKVIDTKENLLSIEVIAASQRLDDVINEYNKLLKKRN